MKRIIIWIMCILILPLFIVISSIKEEENNFFKSRENKIIRVKRLSTNEVDSVNLEDYTLGVLAGEMPVSFEIEALKAQAVAARSYVISRMNDDEDYDVVDSVLNQVYLDIDYLKSAWGSNFDTYMYKLTTAVNETEGEYLSYNDKVADALFFSTSNGYTENSGVVFNVDLPYLSSVSSPWDELANTNFETSTNISKIDFCNKLDLDTCDYIHISNIIKSDINRVSTITINSKSFTGRQIYTLLGIRSTDFEFYINANSITVLTRGYGHGVGMSQYGANGMAKEGYTYDEILYHYYQGTKIKK